MLMMVFLLGWVGWLDGLIHIIVFPPNHDEIGFGFGNLGNLEEESWLPPSPSLPPPFFEFIHYMKCKENNKQQIYTILCISEPT